MTFTSDAPGRLHGLANPRAARSGEEFGPAAPAVVGDIRRA
ncbi:hypothetical protein [Mycobacterium sp. E1747]|nr:hypothetical protein [Mycobacterium sp. E1747]